MFVRDNLIALVERTAEGFGSIGSTGMLTDRGLVYLVFRDGRTLLAGKGFEQTATPEQISQIRRFSEDLKSALQFS